MADTDDKPKPARAAKPAPQPTPAPAPKASPNPKANRVHYIGPAYSPWGLVQQVTDEIPAHVQQRVKALPALAVLFVRVPEFRAATMRLRQQHTPEAVAYRQVLAAIREEARR